MSYLVNRLNAVEAKLRPIAPRRLLVATVPEGGTAEAVAEADSFPLLDDDVIVVVQKPDPDHVGTIRACGAEA